MSASLFHIYRNTPLGRENLLQSAYLCKQLGRSTIHLYCPQQPQAIMYFEHGTVTLNLDSSYVRDRDDAQARAEQLLSRLSVPFEHFEPTAFTGGSIPDLPSDWSMMACPRVISESSSRIGLGRIGPRVREIVKWARFPVFIPCGAAKPWTSVTAFFGGSPVGLRAAQLGVDVAERAGVPLNVLTQLSGEGHEARCRAALDAGGVLGPLLRQQDYAWHRFATGTLQDHLMNVPHDALVVVGAAGESVIRELVFGSKLELVQSALPNPILVVGPNCDRRLLW